MIVTPIYLLIAEDEPAHVEAIRRAFEKTPVEVYAVSTLREYRVCVAERPPDIALVDLNLPDGRAIEILTAPPAVPSFPVIVMTAFGNQAIVVEVLKHGAINYLVKSPDAFTALPSTLDLVLRDWRLLQKHHQAELIMAARLRLIEVAATQSMDEFLQKLLDELEVLTGSQVGFYHFVLPDQKTLTLQAWSTHTSREMCKAEGAGRHYDLAGAGVWADCIRERRAVIHNDYAALPKRKGLPPGHATVIREMVVPVMRGNRVMAALGVGNKPRDYDDDDVQVVSQLADLAWEMVERKRAEEWLRDSNQRLVGALTELRHTQRQLVMQENLRSLGQMAVGIAHDVNNALTPIVGFSELLLSHPEDLADQKKTGEYIQIINTCASDAAGVVRRLREFGRQRAVSDISQTIDLPELVRQMIAITEPRWKDEAQAAGLTIHIETDLQEVPLIDGEEYAFREVLTNLIFNAVEALPDGGTITLGTAVDGEFVRLWVGDNGTGMTEEVHQHCMEPFFTTKGTKGTGLGLAMVYGIVQRHGGRMEVETKPGRGTTLTIRVPIGSSQTVSVSTVEPAVLERKLHVLVVDDESLVRDVTEAFLTNDGHTVKVVATGAAALEQFKAGHFDVVITDKAMPEMNGEQLAVAIHAIAPDMPVILMTGFGEIMKVAGKTPPHIREILSKPFTGEELRQMLTRVLKQ